MAVPTVMDRRVPSRRPGPAHGWGTLAPGQAYVALSRCRSLPGMVLRTPLKPADVHTDQRVQDFLARQVAVLAPVTPSYNV
jgi:hypothetical protein